MSAEPQTILEHAATITNVMKRDRLVQKATRYLRANERRSKEMEADRIRAQLAYNGPGSGTADQKRDAARWLYHLENDLEENSPPTDLSGETKDALYRREKELESYIAEGMLTTEEMRRNPVTAVDRHMRWEKAKKPAILEWKNIRILLNPDSDEQDLANVERLRPSGLRVDGAPTFMADAQIPGFHAMTPLAKENWPLGEPKIDTPLKQAEDREKEELKARLAELEAQIKALSEKPAKPEKRGRKIWTAEQKEEARQRGINLAKKAQEARAAKLAAQLVE